MQPTVTYLLALILFIRCFGPSVGWEAERKVDGQALDPRTIALRELYPYRLWKRSPYAGRRAAKRFKNCYFSPIQCVLMDRRRR
ncbi:hypothetical protein V3C99_007553 [Haemonchus contortus]|uniref:Secreted protein n=1 Tax=Haemonchus contortus TaxID=6289 RepID=A0A7I4YQ69_HAECO|nr:Protein Y73B6BL.35 [Haemonchus contortus]